MADNHPHVYVKRSGIGYCGNRDCGLPEFATVHTVDREHYTDEPLHEVQYGINVGDPAECCDPELITDDPGTASENAQIVRDPYPMRRTVTIIYGPWEPVDLEAL